MYIISFDLYKDPTTIIPILQLREQKFGEVKSGKWQNQERCQGNGFLVTIECNKPLWGCYPEPGTSLSTDNTKVRFNFCLWEVTIRRVFRKQTTALEYVGFDNSTMASQRMIQSTSVGHQGLLEGGDTWARSEEWLIFQENVEGWNGQG